MNAKRGSHAARQRGMEVRDTILHHLHTWTFINVPDLARMLNVSTITAQRHLYWLEDEDKVASCGNSPRFWHLTDVDPDVVAAFEAQMPHFVPAERRRYFVQKLAGIRTVPREGKQA